MEKVITIDDLAKFELTGGQIKNVVLHAARKALADNSKHIKEDHFKQAIINTMNAKKAFSAPRLTGHQKGDFQITRG